MFDIIEYLYDNFLVDDTYPDSESLTRKLSAAGFERDDIDQALNWLGGLSDLDPEGEASLEHAGHRCYTEQEIHRISAEGRGFLAFLESAGLLSPYAREWVLERALALDDAEVPADKIKWIALLAHWRLGGSLEALWLEDLVRDEDDYSPTVH
jgi:Smg protein